MARLHPFRGIRYNMQAVGDIASVTCPPYDVISQAEAVQLQARSPFNAVQIDLPRYSATGDKQYHEAAIKFRSWLKANILKVESAPSLYAYRQTYRVPYSGEYRQLFGLVGALELTPLSERKVLPHEHTFTKPKTDRLNLMRATQANLSPVYSFYSDPQQRIESAWHKYLHSTPVVSVTDSDGNLHELWPVTNANDIQVAVDVLFEVKVFIADGHHRYATALNYQQEMISAEGFQPEAGWNTVMMMLVNLDNEGMTILPTHRVICGLPQLEATTLFHALQADFIISRATVSPNEINDQVQRLVPGTMALYLGDNCLWILKQRNTQKLAQKLPVDKSPAWKGLDVAILHHLILAKVMGISQESIDSQETIRYTRDAAEACAMVDTKIGAVAFLLPAPRVADVRDVALAGDVMPQKTTYFYPKLLTGLVFSDLQRQIGK